MVNLVTVANVCSGSCAAEERFHGLIRLSLDSGRLSRRGALLDCVGADIAGGPGVARSGKGNLEEGQFRVPIARLTGSEANGHPDSHARRCHSAAFLMSCGTPRPLPNIKLRLY